MTTRPRYAIYAAPRPDTRLWAFGCEMLGYDAGRQADVAQPRFEGISPDDLRDRTAEPRQYGFHATLKPPFHLIEGARFEDLVEAAEAFAASQASFTVPALEVSALGAFLALTPTHTSDALHALADASVRSFEPFRAPLSAEDRARRLKSPLTERQIEYLDQWGYPYVFEEFRFHMTLTGRLHHDERAIFRDRLTAHFEAFAEALVVSDIAIYEQVARDQRFAVKARVPLAAVAAAKAGGARA